MNLTFFIISLCLNLSFILIVPLYGQSDKTDKTKTDKTDELVLNSCWEYSAKNLSKQTIGSDNTNIIFVRDNKFIDSIDMLNGKINWTFDTGGTNASQIVVSSEYTYAANVVRKNGGNGGEENILILRAISRHSGLTFWRSEIELNSIYGNKNIANPPYIYKIYNTTDGILIHSSFCFAYVNKLNGSLRWRRCFNSASNDSGLASDISDDVFVFSDGRKIYSFIVDTSEVLLEMPVQTQITSIRIIDKSRIVYGDKKGNIRSVNTGNSRIFQTIKFGGEISSILRTKEGLLVTSFDNFVYMVNINSGRKIWKKRFANRIKDKPSIKGSLAVIISDDNNAFFINTSDGRIINQISLPIDSSFLSPPVFVNEYFFFLTNKGILAFTQGVCHKKESG